MNFDEDISDSVYLSKILYCFIIEEENPYHVEYLVRNRPDILKEHFDILGVLEIK